MSLVLIYVVLKRTINTGYQKAALSPKAVIREPRSTQVRPLGKKHLTN